MEISGKLDPQKFMEMAVDVKSVVERIASGRSVLFVGSGFSRDAIALNDSKFPTATLLANKIGQMGGFDADADLRYASEKYLRLYSPNDLVRVILDSFSVKSVLPHQEVIVNAPWRRIYTTNYDLVVEESGRKSGLRIETVDLNDSPKDYLGEGLTCIHLNGSVRNLKAEDLNGSFKLSSSSYISSEGFVNSAWRLPFKRDLEMCAALIFVGYSLYDVEVQKILYESPELAQKTFFITARDVSEREIYSCSIWNLYFNWSGRACRKNVTLFAWFSCRAQ